MLQNLYDKRNTFGKVSMMGKEGRMLYDGNISGFEAGCYVNEMPVTCRFTIHPQKH